MELARNELGAVRLTADNVTAIMADCLYKDAEITDGVCPADAVIVTPVLGQFGFHPARIESHRQHVRDMLWQLPDQFLASKGGGWSFLNMCMDKNEVQWGEHRNMNDLVALGQALGLVELLLSDFAAHLPGGMPYVKVNLTPQFAAHD